MNEKTVAAIDLPDANLNVLKKPCKIAGWGFTEKSVESKYLMKTSSTQRSSDSRKRICKKARTVNKAFCSRGNFLREAHATKVRFQPLVYLLTPKKFLNCHEAT